MTEDVYDISNLWRPAKLVWQTHLTSFLRSGFIVTAKHWLCVVLVNFDYIYCTASEMWSCGPHLFDWHHLCVSDINHHAHAQPPTTYDFASEPQQAPRRGKKTLVIAVIISKDTVRHYKDRICVNWGDSYMTWTRRCYERYPYKKKSYHGTLTF